MTKNRDPIAVTYRVDPGPPFILAGTAIVPEVGSDNNAFPQPENIGLKTGEQFRAASVLQAQKQLITHLKNSGYPNPKIAKRQVVADHASRTVQVTWKVATGALAVFGDTTIEGLKSIDEDVVREKFEYKPRRAFF